MKYRRIVRLNGTDKNPYEALGFTQNPFPQLAHYEFMGGEAALNKLGGPPIPHDTYKEYIAQVLKGFDKEFIEGVIARFKPGEMVKFEFTFEA